MKLYHGTNASCLKAIQTEGILPRAKSKAKGHWGHTVSSNRNAVYLTTAYAWHFAASACEKNDKGLILEIDRDSLLPWCLCPDEDFMEQATRRLPPSKENPNFAPVEWPMKKRTLHYRGIAENNANLANQSLEHLGTCAYYGAIPWHAVTRYVVIDWDKLNTSMRIRAIDSSVSLMNFKILKDRHHAFTRWFFNDPVEVGELTGNDMWRKAESVSDNSMKMFDEQDARMIEVMANRAGLEVVTNERKSPKSAKYSVIEMSKQGRLSELFKR